MDYTNRNKLFDKRNEIAIIAEKNGIVPARIFHSDEIDFSPSTTDTFNHETDLIELVYVKKSERANIAPIVQYIYRAVDGISQKYNDGGIEIHARDGTLIVIKYITN